MFTYDNGRIVIHRIKKEDNPFISEEKIMKNNTYNKLLIDLPQNDTGNAKRFLLFCRDFVKFNSTTQEWINWSGKYWCSENAYSDIIRLAQTVMEKYYLVVKEDKNLDPQIQKIILSHAKASNNRGNLDNTLNLVKHMNYVKEMTTKPWLLNVQNGIVNLKTKTLLSHHPKHGCTNICICDYDPRAESSRFKKFTKEIVDYNDEMYTYLKRAAGYWSTGLRREEKFYVFLGNGGNGKSKFLEAISYTLGGYANEFPTNALTKTNTDSSKPTPELIPLMHCRFAHTSELQAQNVINDACIKQYTGNAKLLVRKMRQEYSKIDVAFKIVVDTNYAPQFRRLDDAIKRRLVIIPFTKQFKGKDRDDRIEEKLQSDCKYILRFLVDGAYEYFNYGLQEPAIVRQTTMAYCNESDSVMSFLENATTNEQGSLEKSSVLHQAYISYCQTNDFEPLDNKSFSQELTKRGLDKKLKNSGTFFKNIKLI